MPKKNRKYYKDVFQGLGFVAQLGLTMVVNILVMFFIGLLIRNHWHLSVIIILVFVILGVISGAISCYKLLKKNEDKK